MNPMQISEQKEEEKREIEISRFSSVRLLLPYYSYANAFKSKRALIVLQGMKLKETGKIPKP